MRVSTSIEPQSIHAKAWTGENKPTKGEYGQVERKNHLSTTYYADFTVTWSERGISLHLSQEQLAQVGEFTLQWAAADRMVGMALRRLLNVQTGSTSPKPVDAPFDQNVRELERLLPSTGRTPFRAALLAELDHAAKNWRTERNNIVHGMPQDALKTEATILSVRGKRMLVSDLERAMGRAVHVAVIAAQLEMSLLGLNFPCGDEPEDASPPRPRPRPPGLD